MMMRPPRSGQADDRGPVPPDSSVGAGRKVRLRDITPADHRTLIGFDRHPARDRSPQVGGYQHWAAHRTGAADSGDNFQFAIETLRGRMLVGSLCTSQTDPASDKFSYGIGIGPQHRRCGYAGDAITSLLAFMFGQRGYRECEVSIYGGNLASLSLHGGLGFREQARLRDTELLHGGIRYVVLMSITAREFTELHPEFATSHGPGRPRRGRHWRPRRGRHWQNPGLN